MTVVGCDLAIADAYATAATALGSDGMSWLAQQPDVEAMGITDEQRFRFASLMSLAADDAGMPSDPEFRSALVAYLEWGTRLALGNSQVNAPVVEHAPVPRWGWGEAPPYQP